MFVFWKGQLLKSCHIWKDFLYDFIVKKFVSKKIVAEIKRGILLGVSLQKFIVIFFFLIKFTWIKMNSSRFHLYTILHLYTVLHRSVILFTSV